MMFVPLFSQFWLHLILAALSQPKSEPKKNEK